jgi:hypothetical protein
MRLLMLPLKGMPHSNKDEARDVERMQVVARRKPDPSLIRHGNQQRRDVRLQRKRQTENFLGCQATLGLLYARDRLAAPRRVPERSHARS